MGDNLENRVTELEKSPDRRDIDFVMVTDEVIHTEDGWVSVPSTAGDRFPEGFTCTFESVEPTTGEIWRVWEENK
jgi:hypothetical protein